MELMNQPLTGQLGDRLIELLESRDYHTFNMAVAFAKNSGVLRIKGALENFRARGGKVNAYVGVDLGGTSYEALTTLLPLTNSLNVVHSECGQTFHTKMYQFIGANKGLTVVGSHNLTGGGLWTNFETSVIIQEEGFDENESKMVKEMGEYIYRLTSLKGSFMPITAQGDVDRLLQHGYVCEEVVEQMIRARAAEQNGNKLRLFGNGVPAALPPARMSAKEVREKFPVVSGSPEATPRDGGHQTIWFEARRMTGGSRNILDLSMKSLVERGDPAGTCLDLGDPKFMRGSVEFFGVNPANTSDAKEITLNFEGVDYSGNAIIFPVGDKANGTWRLQIKGVAPSGVKITDVFRAEYEESYLVGKIITFKKVRGDYYLMTVFPGSDLDRFKADSYILAWNGSAKGAKRMGLL